MSGYTRSYRAKWTHPAFKNLRDAGIWAWMVDMAAWKPTTVRFQGRPVKLERGQLVTSERFIAEGFEMHKNAVRRLLATMRSDGMIDMAVCAAGTVITICNYSYYQASDRTEVGTSAGPARDQRGTSHGTSHGTGESRRNYSIDDDSEPATGPTTGQSSVSDGSATGPNKKEEKEGNKDTEENTPRECARAKRAAPSQRGTRLPANWDLPDTWRAWAIAEGFGLHLDIDNEAAKFSDYWCSKAGQGATKRDWQATWRNWLRKAVEMKPRGNGRAPPKRTVNDAFDDLAAEGRRKKNGQGFGDEGGGAEVGESPRALAAGGSGTSN